jgi:hypothetical protein
MIFGTIPSVLCLSDDVSEHTVGSIFWIEVFKESTGKPTNQKANYGGDMRKAKVDVSCSV